MSRHSTPPESVTDEQEHPLTTWMKLRDLTQSVLMKKLKISAETAVEATYEGLSGLVRVDNPDSHPGHFFFRDDVLAVLYVGKLPVELKPFFTETELTSLLGKPELKLCSRAGRHHSMLVYPGQGVAYSVSLDGYVDFIEIFQPTTETCYREEFYEEPSKFYR